MAAAAVSDWAVVFAAMGLKLTILPSGCCGMAGTYGHEAEHRDMSERIYGLSWAHHLAENRLAKAPCSRPAIPAAARSSSWTVSSCDIPFRLFWARSGIRPERGKAQDYPALRPSMPVSTKPWSTLKPIRWASPCRAEGGFDVDQL